MNNEGSLRSDLYRCVHNRYVGSLPLPPAVILSGAGGKIAFSDLVEGSPSAMHQRICPTLGYLSTRFAALHFAQNDS